MSDDDWRAGVPYIPTFNAAATPSQIVTAAEAAGLAAPDLARPFTYVDLGCGRGMTALTVAAAYPQARVLGLDIDRLQIGRAAATAKRAGLANAAFVACGFDAPPPPDWRGVDFIAAYGVYSWLDDVVVDQMLAWASAALRPGGFLAISYNTPIRNAQAAPLRHFLLRFMERRTGAPEDRIAAALADAGRLAEAASALFDRNPVLRDTLTTWRGASAGYIAHEALNAVWRLQFPSEVAARLAPFGFAFVGDRDALLHDGAAELAGGDALLMEDLGAMLADRPFRSDVFRKGGAVPVAEPAIPEEALFALAWPPESAVMTREAKKPGPVGEIVASGATAPRSWRALRSLPSLRDLPPGVAAAFLRRAMATQLIGRCADVAPSGEAGGSGFASRLSVEVTTDPELLGLGLALPSAALGGGVQVPPVIAQLVAAAADGLDPGQWAPRAAARLAATLRPGEDSGGTLLRICSDAVPMVRDSWLPFLEMAQVIRPPASKYGRNLV